jgi:GT2 family glycosyltransferase
MTAPRLTVQIVTWNSVAVIDACLESLLAQERRDLLEVIVVDNASRDDSAHRAAAWLARGLRGQVVRETENRGFCGGMNRALARGVGDLVLFLNPDATLPPSFVGDAVAFADARPSDVGIVAPRILLRDGRIDSAGLTLDFVFRGWDRGYGERAEGRFEREEDVFGATGAVALLRRAMLDDVALDDQVLDDKIFAYCDDVDLAWRARLRGWRCVYAPSLVAHHGRAGRNGLRADAGEPRRAFEQTLMVRNRLLVMARCAPLLELLLRLPLLGAFEVARCAFLAWRAPAVLRAYRQIAQLLPSALRDRRRIQGRARSPRIPVEQRPALGGAA